IPRDLSHSERNLKLTLCMIFSYFILRSRNFAVELWTCGAGNDGQAALGCRVECRVAVHVLHYRGQQQALAKSAKHLSYRALRMSIILNIKPDGPYWFTNVSGSESASSRRPRYRPTCRPSLPAP